MPAVGFGFGDAVIMELLMKKKSLPDFSQTPTDILIYSMNNDGNNDDDNKLQIKAIRAATSLRRAGSLSLLSSLL